MGVWVPGCWLAQQRMLRRNHRTGSGNGPPTTPFPAARRARATDTRTVCVPDVHHVGLLPDGRGAFIVSPPSGAMGRGTWVNPSTPPSPWPSLLALKGRLRERTKGPAAPPIAPPLSPPSTPPHPPDPVPPTPPPSPPPDPPNLPKVMDYLSLGGSTDQAELGRQLARMHLAEPTVGARRGGRDVHDKRARMRGAGQSIGIYAADVPPRRTPTPSLGNSGLPSITPLAELPNQMDGWTTGWPSIASGG